MMGYDVTRCTQYFNILENRITIYLYDYDLLVPRALSPLPPTLAAGVGAGGS